MQTWDAITSRRNVRSFTDRPIPAADLDRILEAGRRAPSSAPSIGARVPRALFGMVLWAALFVRCSLAVDAVGVSWAESVPGGGAYATA